MTDRMDVWLQSLLLSWLEFLDWPNILLEGWDIGSLEMLVRREGWLEVWKLGLLQILVCELVLLELEVVSFAGGRAF